MAIRPGLSRDHDRRNELSHQSRRTHRFGSDHPLRSAVIGADSFGEWRSQPTTALGRSSPRPGRWSGQSTKGLAGTAGENRHWVLQIGRMHDLAGGTGEPDVRILKALHRIVNRKMRACRRIANLPVLPQFSAFAGPLTAGWSSPGTDPRTLPPQHPPDLQRQAIPPSHADAEGFSFSTRIPSGGSTRFRLCF